jgi:hypothetical protein
MEFPIGVNEDLEGTQWPKPRLLAIELTVRLRTTILAFCCFGGL